MKPKHTARETPDQAKSELKDPVNDVYKRFQAEVHEFAHEGLGMPDSAARRLVLLVLRAARDELAKGRDIGLLWCWGKAYRLFFTPVVSQSAPPGNKRAR